MRISHLRQIQQLLNLATHDIQVTQQSGAIQFATQPRLDTSSRQCQWRLKLHPFQGARQGASKLGE